MATLKDLQAELRELGDEYPKLKDDERFVAWFLRAYAAEDFAQAVKALTGPFGEKSTDAVLIDDERRAVFIVEGKYRESVMKRAEPRSLVMGFASLARKVAGPVTEFEDFAETLEALARRKLEAVRDRLQRGDYRLHFYYVTLGRCSSALKKEARQEVRTVDMGGNPRAQFAVFDGNAVLATLGEYLDGVAPPVRYVDLPIKDAEVVSHFDASSGIASYVFAIEGDKIGDVVQEAGVRIFARNIRGYLGPSTPVNKAMQETLASRPEWFWYFNNGITIVCDQAREEREGGQRILNVSNPQIINGQQTARELDSAGQKAAKASVAMRVITIPRAGTSRSGDYEAIVSNIVRATNWQNVIQQTDLMSTDRLQILLERDFRRRGYYYIRKRQSKAEARAAGQQYEWHVKKEEIARAVAACRWPSLPLEAGIQALFGQEWYEQIFRRSPRYCLVCYWLMREVQRQAWGISERGYGKHIAAYKLWEDIGPLVRRERMQELFISACESPERSVRFSDALERTVLHCFKGVEKFYRDNRRVDGQELEPSRFFKRTGLVNAEFPTFWSSRRNPHRKNYKKALSTLDDELEALR